MKQAHPAFISMFLDYQECSFEDIVRKEGFKKDAMHCPAQLARREREQADFKMSSLVLEISAP